LKYRQLYSEKLPDAFYSNVELPDGTVRKITRAEMVDPSLLPAGAKVFQLVSLESSGPPGEDTPLQFKGETFRPNKNSHWKLIYPDGMEALKRTGRVTKDGSKLRWKYYNIISTIIRSRSCLRSGTTRPDSILSNDTWLKRVRRL
jgi:hypothetical protein